MRVELPKEVAAIYEAVAALEKKYHPRKFTPDGHLVGSIGEVVAAEKLKLTLHKSSHPGHDAIDQQKRQVQIKMTAGNSVALYADCDRLVVLQIRCPEFAEIVYDGDGAPVWQHCKGRIQKNGQCRISLKQLAAIAASEKERATSSESETIQSEIDLRE